MVFFTGDIHGDIYPVLWFIAEQKLGSDDVIVLLGGAYSVDKYFGFGQTGIGGQMNSLQRRLKEGLKKSWIRWIGISTNG